MIFVITQNEFVSRLELEARGVLQIRICIAKPVKHRLKVVEILTTHQVSKIRNIFEYYVKDFKRKKLFGMHFMTKNIFCNHDMDGCW